MTYATFPTHAELLAALAEQVPDQQFTDYTYEELLVEAADYGLPVQDLIPEEEGN